jgi:hypothetical protein
MTSNTGTALSVLANNNNNKKSYLTNSISLHGDVNHIMNDNHHISTSNANNNNNNNKGFIYK